uniref:Triacylinositol acetyltransferase n=1 Tax=Solanum quitoense TaxID=227725 RepID=A0A7H0XNS0_9SOLN|nr:triacylinositol acetyltransferase [Solanum quitoense]
MAKLEIEIQTRKMLKPSTPTPNHLRTLKLSLLDQIASRKYVPVLFHYLPTSSSEGIAIASEKLQNSLAETLTNFYPLAGRFREDEFSIHCNDEGVEYVETKVVNANLAEFLHQEPKNIELLNDFLPDMDDHRPSSLLLGVQVNVLNCGGVVIGIQISHMVADAFTLATFVNEWAHTNLTRTTKDCLPSFGHLSSLFPARVLSGPQFSPPSNIDPKTITRRFVFDVLAIAKLMETVNSNATLTRPTRVAVVMSLIWKVLTGISTAKRGHSRDSCLGFTINLRGKSNIPSLEHALGNCATNGIVKIEAGKELNELVGKTIRDTCLLISKAASVDDLSSLIVSNWKKGVDRYLRGGDVYGFTSWCGFPWYEADFGWGKPSWVSYVCFDEWHITLLMDTKNGDGIEAWVCLNENDMIEFEKDPHILTLCSPIPK